MNDTIAGDLVLYFVFGLFLASIQLPTNFGRSIALLFAWPVFLIRIIWTEIREDWR
jgi:hypothetical protein